MMPILFIIFDCHIDGGNPWGSHQDLIGGTFQQAFLGLAEHSLFPVWSQEQTVGRTQPRNLLVPHLCRSLQGDLQMGQC